MRKALIMEVGAQWVVVVETAPGNHQQYLCDTLVQAQHWAALLGAPVRRHHDSHSGLRSRQGG